MREAFVCNPFLENVTHIKIANSKLAEKVATFLDCTRTLVQTWRLDLGCAIIGAWGTFNQASERSRRA